MASSTDKQALHRRRRRKIKAKLKTNSTPQPDPLHAPSRITENWKNEAITALWNDSTRTIEVPVDISLHAATQLASTDIEQCLNIVKHTSMADYKSSSIGWSSSLKRKEMADPAMIYLIIRAAPESCESFAPILSTDIIAFISFMITNDDPPYESRNVVYIYEVHIGEKFRGKGMGKFLVALVEAMAKSIGITKTMLTVFKSNVGAIKAYEKMGYSKDGASPPDREIRGRVVEADYMIMSKDGTNDCRESSGAIA